MHTKLGHAPGIVRIWRAPLFAALLGIAAIASGHTDEWFDTHPTPHGGQVRMSGPYHLELLLRDGEMLVYVTDHGDNKIATADFTARATVLAGGTQKRVALAPAGDNKLSAIGVPFTLGMKLVVSVRPKPGEEYVARFVPQSAESKLAPAAAVPHE